MENKNSSSEYSAKFINPEAIVAQLDFQNGMKVADFGCGTGYFTFPIAKKVGNEGVVYAFDILKEKLETIESQAKISGLANIVTKRANLEKLGGSKLADESLDWVILVDMLFQNSDKGVILNEARRVLKKGGKLLLIEWNPLNVSLGPDRKLRIAKEDIMDLADKNELITMEEIYASDFHYGLILIK